MPAGSTSTSFAEPSDRLRWLHPGLAGLRRGLAAPQRIWLRPLLAGDAPGCKKSRRISGSSRQLTNRIPIRGDPGTGSGNLQDADQDRPPCQVPPLPLTRSSSAPSSSSKCASRPWKRHIRSCLPNSRSASSNSRPVSTMAFLGLVRRHSLPQARFTRWSQLRVPVVGRCGDSHARRNSKVALADPMIRSDQEGGSDSR